MCATNIHVFRVFLSAFFGLLFGFAAGLIGVGGGEFRLPVLLYVANLPILISVAVNLVIGLLSVSISFLRRFQLGIFSRITMDSLNHVYWIHNWSLYGSRIDR